MIDRTLPRRLLIGLAAGAGLAAVAPRARAQAARRSPFLDIRDFGAVPNTKGKAGDAIRAAIAAAVSQGGGTVFVSGGRFLSGPIKLHSNVTLHVDAGATLAFSQDFDDYLPMVRSRWEGTEVKNFSPLIYADGAENIAIHGRGLLDGQGSVWWAFFNELRVAREKTGAYPMDSRWQREFLRLNAHLEWPDDPELLKMGFLRPPFIQLIGCKNVSIRDVSLKNSPFWTINPVYCDGVSVAGVSIENPERAPNTDGINPDSCRNVHISDCHISVGDDCITIKSGRDRQGRRINRPAENYTITNCTMLRGHGGVVIGSEMSGGVKKIAISNCVFDGTDRGIRIKSTQGRGGVVEDIRVSNVVMRNIREEAITLNLFYSVVPAEPVSERTPRFRRIRFSSVSGDARQAALLLGLDESPLEDISFSDIDLASTVGFVMKAARRVRLNQVHVDAAEGPAISVEDAEQVDLCDVGTSTPHAGTPCVELSNVRNAYVHDCFAAPGTDQFLRVKGSRSSGIVLGNSALGAAKTAFEISKEVPARGVALASLGPANLGARK